MKHFWNMMALILFGLLVMAMLFMLVGCTLIVQDTTTVNVTVKDSVVSPVVSPTIGIGESK